MLMVDVAKYDSKPTLDAAYQAYGTVPVVPCVLSTDSGSNADSLEDLFIGYSVKNYYGWGGEVWILSPNRTYTKASLYDSTNLSNSIQTALDNRPAIAVRPSFLSNRKNEMAICSLTGSRLDFDVPQSGRYDLSLFSANGRLVGMRHIDCLAGRNSADIGKVANGTYIVKVTGSAGAVSRACFLGSGCYKQSCVEVF